MYQVLKDLDPIVPEGLALFLLVLAASFDALTERE